MFSRTLQAMTVRWLNYAVNSLMEHKDPVPKYWKISRSVLGSLKGQSHEKVGEMRVWGISLGPN
jgi:hypothetical protein